MSFADVKAHTVFGVNGDISPFTSAEQLSIFSAMQSAYDKSATARAMFDNWVNAGKNIIINHTSRDFFAKANTGEVDIDLNFLNNASYIDKSGNVAKDTLVTALVHELGHALTGKLDGSNGTRSLNYSLPDYRGDNVNFVNTIYKELGLPEQVSYVAYDATGTHHQSVGFKYTNGQTIDDAVTVIAGAKYSPAGEFNSSNSLNTKDLLIGDDGNNVLQSGGGNDFLFGGKGNDTLKGGEGNDTAIYLGKPTEYDIRQNADSSWTVKSPRGAMVEGTDRLENVESVQFQNGVRYDLKKGGLTFQTDFAFVIDTTGSMGSSINAVKANATKLINDLFKDDAVDARIGVVGFKDTTNGEPSSIILPFTDQDDFAGRKTAALSAINSITVGGGGDIPETDFDGLKKALDGSLGEWRAGATRHDIVLFTDAPAKDGALAAEVNTLAHNIGATITSSSRTASAGGTVDTFTLAHGTDTSGRDAGSDPDGVAGPTTIDANDPITPDTSTAQVRIFTIYTGPSGQDTSAIQDIAAQTGGQYATSTSPDQLAQLISTIINTGSTGASTVGGGGSGGGGGGGGAIPAGAAPVAVADSYMSSFGSQLVIAASAGVLANDTLQGDGPLKVVGVNGTIGNVGSTIAGSYGSLVLAADGSFTYTPDATKAPASGTVVDHFTYRESGNGLEALANLDITLTAANPGSATLLSTLVHDATSPGGQAYALYQGLFGRAPDTAGLQALSTALANGTSLHDATQALLASPEGQSHFGGLDNAGFVAQLYQEILNRPADSAGLATATAALDHGLSRADLADSFVFSPEHLGQLQSTFTAGIAVPDPHAVSVAQAYYSLLGRAPDASGLQAYDNASLHDVAEGLMHSTEYASLTGMTSDIAYVAELYQHLLDRPADSAGAQTWTAALAGGANRAGVANALLDSAEFQSHYAGQSSAAYVEALYQHVLGRPGDTAGVQTWANALDHGASRADVAHAFTASSEFQAQAGGQSDAAFVEGLYTHALGRSADAAGEQAWLSALSHGASRADVVAGLIQSAEGQAHLTAQIAHDWHLA